ncbi:hypothetical protein JHK87_001216 [Glycine soja]|nr:hypothetical protein JHK87_001216 [Glycine soja]
MEDTQTSDASCLRQIANRSCTRSVNALSPLPEPSPTNCVAIEDANPALASSPVGVDEVKDVTARSDDNKAKDNDSDDNVDFVAGNVKLITTKEVWDQYLEEARRDGKIREGYNNVQLCLTMFNSNDLPKKYSVNLSDSFVNTKVKTQTTMSCFQHVYREGNTIADCLAKEGSSSPQDLIILQQCPSALFPVYVADVIGHSYVRS